MKNFLIYFAAVVASTSAFEIPSYHIFMNCYAPICSLDGTYGFHCKNGLCSYVCTAAGCRQDGLPNRGMLGTTNIIFYGCHGPACSMEGFYGYGCNEGVCQYVCSSHGCYEGTRTRRRTRTWKIQSELSSQDGQESDSLPRTLQETLTKKTTLVPNLSPALSTSSFVTSASNTSTTSTEPTNSTTTTTSNERTTTSTVRPIKTTEEKSFENRAENLQKTPKLKLPENNKISKPSKGEKSKRSKRR